MFTFACANKKTNKLYRTPDGIQRMCHEGKEFMNAEITWPNLVWLESLIW